MSLREMLHQIVQKSVGEVHSLSMNTARVGKTICVFKLAAVILIKYDIFQQPRIKIQ